MINRQFRFGLLCLNKKHGPASPVPRVFLARCFARLVVSIESTTLPHMAPDRRVFEEAIDLPR